MGDRAEEEIDDVLERVTDLINEGRTKYPGMTYEQGVEAAIRWMTGDWEENPAD
jgi:hypothetical protein